MRLSSGSFDNRGGGIIEALAGSEVELAAATVVGGMLQTSDDGVIETAGSATLNGSTTAVWPLAAANIKAVSPSLSFASTSVSA